MDWLHGKDSNGEACDEGYKTNENEESSEEELSYEESIESEEDEDEEAYDPGPPLTFEIGLIDTYQPVIQTNGPENTELVPNLDQQDLDSIEGSPPASSPESDDPTYYEPLCTACFNGIFPCRMRPVGHNVTVRGDVYCNCCETTSG